MASMIIHHKVRDYAAWRQGYDAHELSRVGAGITDARVYRNAEDPNDVVIVANVSDTAKARAWTASDDLKTAMQKAGVLGHPQFIWSADTYWRLSPQRRSKDCSKS